jgi:long-chain acyl-CoA synthetase
MSLDLSLSVKQLLATASDAGAIAFGGAWRSWRWLARAVEAIEVVLAQAGLEDGDAVALVARNRPQHIAAIAAQLVGARTTVMIYSAQSAAGIAADIAKVGVRAVMADADDWSPEAIAAAKAAGVVGIALSDDADAPAQPVEGLLTRAATAARRPDMAFELLSSGTTGAPKRVPLSWTAVGEAVADSAQVYAPAIGQVNQTPAIVVHPIGNVSGVTFVVPPLVFGQPMAVLEKFTLDAWIEAIRTYRPARASVPPAAVAMLLDADTPKSDLESLTVIGVGGVKMEPELQRRFEARYGIPVLPAYGATEFGGVIANWSLDLHRQFGAAKIGSVGRPRPGIELRVVDPDRFEPVPDGEIGLLEASVPRVGPGFIRTTDLGRIDEDGFIFLHGRADQAINRGGFKVLPETVVSALCAHPAVGDAVVFGVPDARLGEKPVAAVEPRVGHPAPSADELLAFLRDRLIAYQIPARLIVVDALPRTGSMKVSIPETRALFSTDQPS